MPLRGEVVYHQPSPGFGVRLINISIMERNVLTHVVAMSRKDQAASLAYPR